MDGWRGCDAAAAAVAAVVTAAILVRDTAAFVDVVRSSSRASPRAKRGSDRLWRQRKTERRGERDVSRRGQTIAQLLTHKPP